MATKKWKSEKPVDCDICKCSLTNDDYFIDGRLEYGGQWAIMCVECFNKYGVGLGLGRGQKYDWDTLEKVAG